MRALVHLTPADEGPYPLRVPELEVHPGASPGSGGDLAGDWAGRWSFPVAVRNPFPFGVAVTLHLVPRGGAWEAEGLPVAAQLAPGEELETPLALTGGSRSPGPDPLG